MYGLNIHLKSFKLNSNIVNGNDKVRVSITTFPENYKEAFITEAKQMSFVHHFFTVNITNKTQKIVIVFRKVGFLDNPIIASATISSKELPNEYCNNVEMKTMNIYEPLQTSSKKRRIFGEMQIQFSLTSAFPTFKVNNKDNNKQKSMKIMHSNTNKYSKINEENDKYSNSNSMLEYPKVNNENPIYYDSLFC